MDLSKNFTRARTVALSCTRSYNKTGLEAHADYPFVISGKLKVHILCSPKCKNRNISERLFYINPPLIPPHVLSDFVVSPPNPPAMTEV
jgi:hypothetical protein